MIKPLSEPSVKIVLIAQKLITLLASGCVAAVVLSTIAYQRKRSWDTLIGGAARPSGEPPEFPTEGNAGHHDGDEDKTAEHWPHEPTGSAYRVAPVSHGSSSNTSWCT